MAVRREIPEYDGVYFITITCGEWLHLFERADAYYAVYKWFDHLKNKGHFIVGYVIMPNHLHALIGFRNTMGESINRIVGTGKRFMAYEIAKQLRAKNDTETLARLSSKVNATDSRRGKLHEVFEPSFDWKECKSIKFGLRRVSVLGTLRNSHHRVIKCTAREFSHDYLPRMAVRKEIPEYDGVY